MLPKRTQITIAIAWILFWLLMIGTALQEYLRDYDSMLWKPVLWESSSAVTATLLLFLQRRATRRYDHLLATPWRWFMRQAPWLLIYWISFVPIAFSLRFAVYWMAGESYDPQPSWPNIFLYEDVKITVFFSIFAAILFGLLSYHAMQEEKLRVERANASLREAQLLRLTQQMQPHFLFNALNTISSLMHSDVARADALLIQLADVLRTTLSVSEQHQVALEVELRLLRGYAQLMCERFSDRVSVEWRIDEALLSCQVPVMSMQPLLENIFKHTVERHRQPTAIVVSASRVDSDAGGAGMLVLRLEDDGGTLPEAGPGGADADTGIGVRNLRARLASLYDGRASFELSQLSPAGVRAEMRLPCAS
jgi:hypothetical protein